MCEYCNGVKTEKEMEKVYNERFDEYEREIAKYGRKIYVKATKFDYCPMCGRKLSE